VHLRGHDSHGRGRREGKRLGGSAGALARTAAERSPSSGADVRLDKGELKVRCPKVEVRYDAIPNITWASGTGGVVAELKGVRA
jgi:hypothetical protein